MSAANSHDGKVVALAGGIGAAKFLTGLSAVIPPESITVISNTGDDIELFGLRICPDLDTVMYTLAGVVSVERGWGLEGETFKSLAWMSRYAGEQWFNLGDQDLATHIYRSDRLRSGVSLTEVTAHLCSSLGVRSTILPMTDSYAPTFVETDEGRMHFQKYFVGRHCEPRVNALDLSIASASNSAAGVVESILSARAVIVCPSNPFISIGPILAVPGIRDALQQTRASVAAITPIVDGRALKGPAADMLRDLGHEVSARAVAGIYSDFVDLFILDSEDSESASDIQELGMRSLITDTVMKGDADKTRLASETLTALLG